MSKLVINWEGISKLIGRSVSSAEEVGDKHRDLARCLYELENGIEIAKERALDRKVVNLFRVIALEAHKQGLDLFEERVIDGWTITHSYIKLMKERGFKIEYDDNSGKPRYIFSWVFAV